MLHTRRQMLKLGLGTVPLTCLIANRTSLFAAVPAAPKPNSKFNGVQIGIIAPYSFRGMPSTAEDILRYMVELGVSAVEMQNGPVESFAGAPGGGGGRGGRGGGPGGAPAIPGLTADQQAAVTAMNEAVASQTQALTGARAALAQATFSDATGIPARLAAVNAAELELAKAKADAFARLQTTPERLNAQQIDALVAQASGGARGGRGSPGGPGGGGPGAGGNNEMTQWRATVSMDRFKTLRKMYNDAGVSIYGFKLGLSLNSPESEYEYAFNVCDALGANQLTMELPNSATTKRIGEYAAKRKIWVGYHAHTQAHLTFWDEAFSQSPYNGANIDIGHYVAGSSQSPIPFIEKHHARITSMHLKDRKINNGPNMPWGQGDTPIKEVLQLMKKEKHTYPATIELEYNTPQGSTVMAELAKCVQYAKDALA
jgi:sugar phosphate isomerase/epimerase